MSSPEMVHRPQAGRDPVISAIVPIHDAAATLPRCLQALAASHHPAWELIMVDDGSGDDSARIAARHGSAPCGAFLLTAARAGGPAHARNRGARVARGQILFFVDSDVAVRPDTVGRIAALFRSDRGLAACFGSYDTAPPAPNFLSQYKNLLHHYVHQQGRNDAGTFWAGCGAVRRRTFLALGGFNTAYARPSVEDIEFGGRLRRQGGRIRLEKGLQVTHLKRWTPARLIHSDIFDRALPWSRLLLRQGEVPDDLNLRRGQRLSALLVWLGAVALLLMPFFPALLLAGVACPLLLLGLNRHFYQFLAAQRGRSFALRALPWHWFYFLYSSLVFALVFLYATLAPPRAGSAGGRARRPPG